MNFRCKLLVVGGGTGGCTMAAKLASKIGHRNCIVLEPSERHYYQPMFTLVGGGIRHLPECYRSMRSVLPKGVQWMRDEAFKFEPQTNKIFTRNGHEITYDLLIVAVGLQLNYDRVGG